MSEKKAQGGWSLKGLIKLARCKFCEKPNNAPSFMLRIEKRCRTCSFVFEDFNFSTVSISNYVRWYC